MKKRVNLASFLTYRHALPCLLRPLLLILAVLLSGEPASAAGEAGPSPAASTAASIAPIAAVTPAEARQALDVLQDETKRSQLVETLRTIAAASSSPSSQLASPSGSALPASPPPAAPATPAATSHGLGAVLLLQMSHWVGNIFLTITAAARTITDFPVMWHWTTSRLRDSETRALLFAGIWRLGIVIGSALAAEWLAGRGFARLSEPLRAIRRQNPPRTWEKAGRWPLALVILILDLLPVAVFALVGNLVLGTMTDASDPTGLTAVSLLYAYALCRVVMCLTRMLVAPTTNALRLLPVDDQTAAYMEVWVRRITGVAVFGTALSGLAEVLGLNEAAHEALLKLFMLIVHLFIVIIVLQCRHTVAAWIRVEGRHGPLAMLRNRVGDLWHYFAIIFVMGLWGVWAFGLKDGYAQLLHFLAVTLLVLVAARLITVAVLSAFDRGFRINRAWAEHFPGLEARANRYYPVLRAGIALTLAIVTGLTLSEVWGLDALVWFKSGSVGGRLLSAVCSVIISAVVAVAVWESGDATLERYLSRLARQKDAIQTARLRTLLPILRTALLVVILAIGCLTILGELGVNIGPLLASAGILGVALGFGSQKLVQDLITGIFLLLEDAMEVGDTVTVSGLSGVVEHLSIRTIRLRAGDGSVHLIPFSAVTAVTNTNRGVGNAAVSVNVSIHEDTDRVSEAMKRIALEMRNDDAFKDMMHSDLELWGIDKVDASVVTIVGQIVCTDTGRWGVQREYNRRVKIKFQEMGIVIANPTQTIVLQTPPAATSPPVTKAGAADPTPTTVKDSPPPTALGHDH